MEPMESCVPPGFRFHPTDEELVGYYLKKKVTSQRIDLDVIRDIDLYRIEPWDLQERCRIGYEEQNEWYFFSHKDKKYPTGTRTNRATIAGFWKATGRDKAVYDKAKLIGMRKTLVFYKGRAPNGQKSDWIMHEYRLETDENGPPQEEGWVVCRAFKKKATAQSNQNKGIDQGWDSASNYFFDQADETRILNSVMDTPDRRHHYLPRNPPSFIPSSSSPHNYLCKQEIEHRTNNRSNLSIPMQSDHHHHHPFMQLPQLESPSFSLMKRPMISDHVTNNHDLEGLEKMKKGKYNAGSMEKVTDWRALDKFVASQLSHDHNEQPGDHQGVGSSFGVHHNQGIMNNDDMALFLLQSTNGGRDDQEEEEEEEEEDGEKLISGFLASSSESELGICIFDK
ncbi:hypothetical protein V2J09_009511 [Rumex salicifolius]